MFFSLSVKYVYGKPTGCRSFSTKGKQPIKSVQERSNISSNSSGLQHAALEEHTAAPMFMAGCNNKGNVMGIKSR